MLRPGCFFCIEAALDSGAGLPVRRASNWKGQWDMVQFDLGGWGLGSQASYYGCCYSPGDVPLPFQNSNTPLTQTGQDLWTWTGEGDNHGATRKLRDCWYFYEAAF